MQAYSQDLRDRVLGALEWEKGATAIVARYEVSRVWVYQVKTRCERHWPSHLPGGKGGEAGARLEL